MKTRLLIISFLMAIGIFANAQSHYIGDIVTAPDGQQGIVFFVTDDGLDYWLVALNDLPQPYAWGNLTDIPDLENLEDSFFIHYNPCGYDATMAMKNYQGDNSDYAASAVNTKQYWCIPSTGQASKLYAALPYIQHLFSQYGGTAPGINYDHYWTSTESSYNQAYVIYLGITNYQGGAITKAFKDEHLGVRPIWSLSCSGDLPSVGQIVTPEEICSGSSLTLEVPDTQNANYGGWQIAPNDDFFNYQEYQGEELDDSYDGWYLRYYAHNILGTTYSNTVQISVLPANTTSFSASSCDSYTWNGETYTESGTYTQLFPMPNSCDSIVTLYLTIGHEYDINFNTSSCSDYYWNGQIYTQSGDYTQTFTSIYGCDSIVTMHLSIYEPASSEISATACDSYEWNGQTYTTSGDYTQTLHTTHGCDSIVTLHLTIESFEEMQAIEGDAAVDTYTTSTSLYTQPGFNNSTTYQWVLLPDQAGTVAGFGSTAIVTWATDYQGDATLGVGITTPCGEGFNSLTINVKNSFDISENNIHAKLYPNPTSGNITIEAAGMQHITVMNTLGQVVADMDLDTDATSIDMTSFGKGVYVVRIQTKDGSCIRRIGVE